MRAVIYERTGGTEVLSVVHRPQPRPGPGEVLVEVAVSGVNPTDWKARRGPGELTIPQVPHHDGAGTVKAVGPGVERPMRGDRVWLWDVAFDRPSGTAQELVVVPAAHAVPMADAVSFDVGASLGIPALTAHRCLTAGLDTPEQLSESALKGRNVLVAGGAGAVGHAAIQLASWAGAAVISTVSSPRKAQLAAAAGAHRVIDYSQVDVATAVRSVAPLGVDLIVEVNPSSNLALDIAVVAPNGTIAIYASDGPDLVPFPIRAAMLKNVRTQFVLTYTTTTSQKTAAVQSVARAADAGVLEVGEDAGLPLTRFPLNQTGAAHDLVQSGFTGKVLIDVPPLT
ncbi:NADPH:quinone reductase [Nocardioides sp. Root1257]|uniref:NADPH:quinone reductase n=1 Tax=unclassified Nocardioides TaxID=2615069 RepID=UPI0006F21EFF|nr:MULTISPECIES: NADPH:quinone reductase [unclassified Nocardioides]KQW50972.1 NADPH:quinone reductase [Nocardioides sp. Root1257]KRC53768.1 NADPH:quinone reductase [Nocardioides sp. Root224]